MNSLRAVGPLPADAGPDAVEEALERHQGDAPHRRLVCEDGEDAARLMDPLRPRLAGETEVVMVLRGPRDREPAPGLAREVDAATLHPVEVATMLDEPELRDAPGARAVAEEVVARGGRWRRRRPRACSAAPGRAGTGATRRSTPTGGPPRSRTWARCPTCAGTAWPGRRSLRSTRPSPTAASSC